MNRIKLNVVLSSLIFILFLSGGSLMSSEVQSQHSSASFFESPEAAVPVIAELLRKEGFRDLASYYDLTGSGIDRSEL